MKWSASSVPFLLVRGLESRSRAAAGVPRRSSFSSVIALTVQGDLLIVLSRVTAQAVAVTTIGRAGHFRGGWKRRKNHGHQPHLRRWPVTYGSDRGAGQFPQPGKNCP